MSTEIWDAYDSEFRKIEGITLIRGETIPDGCFHLVSEVIVQHMDGSYLLMQRDKRKHLGGMWEATAGGSAIQDENPLDCAFRELREETGIAAKELGEIGRVLHHGHKTIYVEFLCKTDIEKNTIILQEGETSDFQWISGTELCHMRREELATKRIFNFLEEFCL